MKKRSLVENVHDPAMRTGGSKFIGELGFAGEASEPAVSIPPK